LLNLSHPRQQTKQRAGVARFARVARAYEWPCKNS